MLLTVVCVWSSDLTEDWLPHEESHVEGEGGQEADVEQDDDHQVPLPRHPGPHQVLLQLENFGQWIEALEFMNRFDEKVIGKNRKTNP